MSKKWALKNEKPVKIRKSESDFKTWKCSTPLIVYKTKIKVKIYTNVC